MPGALHEVKVLEIAQVMAIPICGMLLSDLGAGVVKVEPPWGDASRYTMQPVLPGESKSFAVLNRGKRSVGLNLTDQRTRPALEALVRASDVVLVSAKAEDVASFKLGYDHLRALKPGLIYLEHDAYGRKGPMGGNGGYDLTAGGLSGLTALIGKERDGHPIYTQPAVLDLATGYLSAMAVCAALYVRRATGQGQRLETSLLSTGMAALVNVTHDFPAVEPDLRSEFLESLAQLRERGAGYEEMQQLRARTVQRGRRGNVYYRYYKTKDSAISIGCLSPALQHRFAAAIGIADPRRDPEFDAGAQGANEQLAKFVAEAEETMRSRTTAEWTALLDEQRIPNSPVLFPEEAIDHPQVAANDYIIELDHEILGPYRTFAPPVRMDGTPTKAQGPAPPLAKHTEEVLLEAGLAQDAIEELIDAGVAGARVLDS